MEENLNSRKKRVVSVETPMGTRKVTLVYVDKDAVDVNQNWCESFCNYSKICPHLPHPEHQDDRDLSFTDWCGDLGEKITDGHSLLPYEGVEDLYPKGSEAFQILNAVDKLVPLSVLRRVVCKEMCLYYKEDGSDCAEKNKSCMIHDILKQTHSDFPWQRTEENGDVKDNRAWTIEQLKENVKKANEED